MPATRNPRRAIAHRDPSVQGAVPRRRRPALGPLFFPALLALTAGLVASPAWADEAPESNNKDSGFLSDFSVTVGGGGLYSPTFTGSDSYEATALPYLDITWKDRVFLNVHDGLGVKALRDDDTGSEWLKGYEVGVAIRPSDARDEDDDDHLTGLGDIDLSAEAGLFAAAEIGAFDVGAEIYQDIGDGHEGMTAEFSIGMTRALTDRFFLSGEAALHLADSSYMESFFDVSASQSASSGLSQYDAGAGLYATSFGVTARYQITQGWAVMGLAEVTRLVGDAADSPIAEEEAGVTLGTFLVYRF